MLKVCNLVKWFGNFCALDNVSFEVKRGEVFGLLGTNGAGKTTTMRICTTLLQPSCGKVLLDGVDIFQDPINTKKRIGYVPETPYFYQKLTGRELLLFLGRVRGLESTEERIEDLACTFEFEGLDTEIGAYSKGMMQRLSIMTALLHSPALLVLDEPTSGLDPRQGSIVKRLIREEREKGKAVFLSTHITANAEEVCDRIGIIHRGRILALGSVDEVKKRANATTLEEAFVRIVEGA